MTERSDAPVDLDRERRIRCAVTDLRDVLDNDLALLARTRAMLAGEIACPELEDPTMRDADQQMSIRVPAGTLERADALISALDGTAEFKTFRCTKSAILRLAVIRGLDAMEAEHKGKRRGA